MRLKQSETNTVINPLYVRASKRISLGFHDKFASETRGGNKDVYGYRQHWTRRKNFESFNFSMKYKIISSMQLGVGIKTSKKKAFLIEIFISYI